jgi:hypothetical protein
MQRQPENAASGVTFRHEGLLVVITRFIHHRFLLILIGAHTLSALFPGSDWPCEKSISEM